jgi:hypothetical protein
MELSSFDCDCNLQKKLRFQVPKITAHLRPASSPTGRQAQPLVGPRLMQGQSEPGTMAQPLRPTAQRVRDIVAMIVKIYPPILTNRRSKR